MQSVFAAGPFKGIIDPETGLAIPAERRGIEAVLDYFDAAGFQRVQLAPGAEDWGGAMLKPDECTRFDVQEIEASDRFVCFPGEPASPGTHIETGWASLLGKPMVLIVRNLFSHSFLVRGLHSVTDVVYVETADRKTLVGASVADALS